MKSSPISFQRQIFSSVPLTQNLSKTLIMILFVKWNLIKRILLRLPDMLLTNGKILNSIMLWMNYAISSKPWTVSSAFTWSTRRLWKIILSASLTKPILVLILTLTVLHAVTAARNGLILHLHTGMWTVSVKCPWMPLSTIIKTGANARSTTSVSQKLKKSMEKRRNLFLYFQRMPLQSLLLSRL